MSQCVNSSVWRSAGYTMQQCATPVHIGAGSRDSAPTLVHTSTKQRDGLPTHVHCVGWRDGVPTPMPVTIGWRDGFPNAVHRSIWRDGFPTPVQVSIGLRDNVATPAHSGTWLCICKGEERKGEPPAEYHRGPGSLCRRCCLFLPLLGGGCTAAKAWGGEEGRPCAGYRVVQVV